MSKVQGFGNLSRIRLWLVVLLAIASPFFADQFVASSIAAVSYLLVMSLLLVRARAEARLRRPAQAWLALIGTTLVAGLAGWELFLNTQPNHYVWQLCVVSALLVIADWLTLRARNKALNAMPNLMELLPDNADVFDGQEINRVPLHELNVGDVVLVRPGSRVPGDGTVIQGEAKLDESDITGDQIAALATAGKAVLAGSINVSSRKANHALTVRIDAVGNDVLLAALLRRVSELAAEPVKREDTAVVFSTIGAVLVLAIGLFGAGMWLVLEPNNWLVAIACLATVLVGSNVSSAAASLPVAKVLTNTALARSGVLPRTRRAIMLTRHSHVVVFNLNGTLNLGNPTLVDVHLARNTSFGSKDQVLAMAAAAQARSDHQLARVIGALAQKRDLALPELYEVEPHPLGVSARYDGSSVLVGGPGFLTSNNVPIDVNDLVTVASANERGNTIVYVVVDSLLVGYLEFANEIRQTAKEMVRTLQWQRKRVVMLTGEASGVAHAVAKELGITEVFAEIPRDKKADVIRKLQEDTSIVVMVGDPIDDATTLGVAQVGIALGVGADIGSASADVMVITPEPRAVGMLIQVAKRYSNKAVVNLFFGLLLNITTLGLAGFFGWPALGAVVLLVSTFLIIRNTSRLARI